MLSGMWYCPSCVDKKAAVSAKMELGMILDCKPGFKFGCDPEVFIKNPEGIYVSAEGLLPGTKSDPHKVEGGAIQVDGMAGEFNIDPAENFEDWNERIKSVMIQMMDMLPKGYTIDPVASVVFNQDVYDASPDVAKELGCQPDFNAWTGEVNPPPSDPENPYLRTASGHIHIGWTEEADLMDVQHIMNCRDLVKQLDWYLGAWSTKFDKDPTRRRLYGKAGACRFKPYGVEYRVLSNFWISKKEHRLAVWNRLQQGIEDMRNSVLSELAKPAAKAEVMNSINGAIMSPFLAKEFRYPVATLDRSYARF